MSPGFELTTLVQPQLLTKKRLWNTIVSFVYSKFMEQNLEGSSLKANPHLMALCKPFFPFSFFALWHARKKLLLFFYSKCLILWLHPREPACCPLHLIFLGPFFWRNEFFIFFTEIQSIFYFPLFVFRCLGVFLDTLMV